jgi:8-oxo-dGTP pyrophosphatase MutT (NUDIX family)
MRRAGTEYGEGQFAFPAGHVDRGETPTASIIRETLEELGINITPASLAPAGVMFRRSLTT